MARERATGRPTSEAPTIPRRRFDTPADLRRRRSKGRTQAIRVRALQMGYHGLVRRRPGEVFDYALEGGQPLPTWVEPLDGTAEEAPVTAPAGESDTRPTDVEVI